MHKLPTFNGDHLTLNMLFSFHNLNFVKHSHRMLFHLEHHFGQFINVIYIIKCLNI